MTILHIIIFDALIEQKKKKIFIDLQTSFKDNGLLALP